MNRQAPRIRAPRTKRVTIKSIMLPGVRKFWTSRKSVATVATIIVLLVVSLVGFYFTYTPDYKSSIRAEILRQLNGTEIDGLVAGQTPHRGQRRDTSRDTVDALEIVFDIDIYSIERLTGERWYSHNAKQWEISAGGSLLTDNYFAIPISGDKKTISIFIFRRSGSKWVFDQELKPGFPVSTLALEGNVLAIGDNTKKRIFRRVNDAWALEQTIRPDDHQIASSYSRPGFALSDKTMAVSWNDGFIELFDYKPDQWISNQRIDRQFLQLDRADDIHIAAMEGNRLVLVSYNDTRWSDEYDQIVQVHILKQEGGGWAVEQKITEESFPEVQLTDGDGYNDDISASIHGKSLVVGNSAHNAVYVFRRNAEQWVLEEVITEATFPEIDLEWEPSYGEPDFGYGVAVKDEMLVVTEYVDAVYVFIKDGDGGTWRLGVKALDGNNRFGAPIITKDDTIFIVDLDNIYALRRSPLEILEGSSVESSLVEQPGR